MGYFDKKDRIKQMEEAAGITLPSPTVPPSQFIVPEKRMVPDPMPANSVYPLGAIPEKKKVSGLLDRSTMGSPPFSKSELKQGYRKVGKGRK